LTPSLFVSILVTDTAYERGIYTNTQFALAIHILVLLAASDEKQVTSSAIATSVNTNAVFIRRILGLLLRAGLVVSQSGVGGGWRLRRSACAINLLDVYKAVQDDGLLALHRSQPNPRCPIGANIEQALRESFVVAEGAFQAALAQQTIDQVRETVLAGARARAS